MAKNNEELTTMGFDFSSMTGGALVSAFGDFGDDTEEIYLDDADGGRLPRLRLAQGLSPEVADGTARPGDWVLSDHEAEKFVDLLPIDRYASRLRLGKNQDGRRAPVLCRADKVRFTKPVELLPLHGQGDPGIACAECPFSKWTPKEDGSGNNPPECLLIHTFEAISLTHGTIVEVQFKKTQERVAKELAKALKDGGGMKKVLIRLRQEKKVNAAKQPYFIPAFEVIQPTPEHIAKFNEVKALL